MFKGLKKTKTIIALLLSVIIALEPVSSVIAMETDAQNVVIDGDAELVEEISEEIEETYVDEQEDIPEEDIEGDEPQISDPEESESEDAEEVEALEESEESEAEIIEELLALDGEELLESTEIEELPDSYVLSADRIEEKAAMSAMVDDFELALEGIDYVTNQVFFLTDSLDEAEMVAEAYCGELVSFEDGVALINLNKNKAGVKEVFAAASNMTLNLPAAYPNYYRYIVDEIDTDDVVTVTSDSLDEAIVVEAEDDETEGEEIVLFDDDAVTVTEEVSETSDFSYEEDEELSESSDYAEVSSATISGYNDPMLKTSNGLYQWHHATIGSSYAWSSNIRGSGIKVMVIDTGVIASHEDFPEITSYYYSGSFKNGVDDNEHGTFVCGEIISKYNNSIGGVGVAPDATLYSYKAGDSRGSFSDASIIAGINKATSLGVDVVNMSLGGYSYNSSYLVPITNAYNKGVLIVVAAGNDNTNSFSYPASYPHVISVGATDRGNGRTYFSSYGTNVDVAAPGYEIKSATYNGGYGSMNGTSMACPIVAGETALLLQAAKKGMVKGVSASVASTKNGKRVDAIEKALKASCKKASAGMGSGIPYLPKALGIDTATQKPAVPNIKIVTSADNQSVNVTFVNDTGKTICYTTDGTKPTYPISGTTSSTTAASKTITINDRQTVKVQAMAVNSAGEVSGIKTVSVKLKPYVSKISITGPTNVAKGKKIALAATVTPDYATNKKLEWRFVSSASASINDNITADVKKKGLTVSNGNVSATRTAVKGTYYVRAIASDRKTINATFKVNVVDNGTVSKMSFSGKTLNVNRASSSTTVNLMNTSSQVYLNALNLSNARITDGSKFIWSSTNPKVVTVDSKGVATFVGGGKAVINVVSNDGNVVKSSLNVTVTQLPTSISITTPSIGGVKYLSAGKSLQLQSAVYPATAANKKVTWEPYISGKSAADAAKTFASKGVTVTPSGKITATAKATTGSYNVICRSVADSKILSSAYKITVVSGSISGIQVDKKSTNIFRVSGNYSAPISGKIKFTLSGTTGFNQDSYKITNSNPKLVSVSGARSGNVVTVTATSTGAGIGKSTITLESTDGSNKKVSCTVNVINPASELLLGAEGDTGYWVAPGKTIQIKSALGSDFGKLSSNKINWSVSDNSVASVNSSGRVAIKKNAWYQSITVYGVAADGSGARGQISVQINPYKTTVTGLDRHSSRTTFGAYKGYSSIFTVNYSGYFKSLQITSSNPKVAAAYLTYNNGYPCVKVVGVSRGNTTVTVKPIDGYGKATKFKFRVR